MPRLISHWALYRRINPKGMEEHLEHIVPGPEPARQKVSMLKRHMFAYRKKQNIKIGVILDPVLAVFKL